MRMMISSNLYKDQKPNGIVLLTGIKTSMPEEATVRKTVKTGVYRSGTSGLVLAEPNKLAYPEVYRNGSRLAYYATLFNSIEVNSSFYKIPRQITFARWATEVPDGFRFTVKMWKG